jgi:hypothetical protein
MGQRTETMQNLPEVLKLTYTKRETKANTSSEYDIFEKY